ncbi:MAG: iron-containing alcohol dehydrogenase family protein [Spirochaetes bacterium]|nr:iron-containing alcohol dehydrogenase family protein [Spirochaetota bacterium]
MYEAERDLRIQCGPSNYFSHAGSIEKIKDFFQSEEIEGAVVIAGEKAYSAAEKYINPLPISHDNVIIFKGKCIRNEISDLSLKVQSAANITSGSPIIGIGGGTVLDSAKAVAAGLKRKFVAIPTIVSTCSAWTPLSVWYDRTGKVESIKFYPESAYLVLVEPMILINSPLEYLRAGIGDTLAKWYESEVICRKKSRIPFTADTALCISKEIRDVIFRKGASALRDAAGGILSDDYHDIVDVVIAGGGAVGGFGERLSRVAGAHSVHNGLCALNLCKNNIHGLKVSYGILVQLALMKDYDELEITADFMRQTGLPLSLKDFGVRNSDDVMKILLDNILVPSESIHYLPCEVSRDSLDDAIRYVDNMQMF